MCKRDIEQCVEGIGWDKIIEQIKYSVTESCVMCDNHVKSYERPKRDGCKNCHVGKLIMMIGGNVE